MIGTRITINDTSIQDKTDRIILPVMDGLEMALFLSAGGDGKNYAPGSDVMPAIVGAPGQNQYSKTFPDIDTCINTKLRDDSEFTVFIVNKPGPMPDGVGYVPFWGNWDRSAAGETGKGVGLGSGLVQANSDAVTVVASSVPVADSAKPSATTGRRENRNVAGLAYNNTWRCSVLRITENENYFADMTKTRDAGSVAMTDGHVKDNRFASHILLAGSNHEPGNKNIAPSPETALMLFYRRGLALDEIATMYAWAQGYCARRGIQI